VKLSEYTGHCPGGLGCVVAVWNPVQGCFELGFSLVGRAFAIEQLASFALSFGALPGLQHQQRDKNDHKRGNACYDPGIFQVVLNQIGLQ